MTTLEFVSYLSTLDIKLWQEGERLRVSAPKGVLTPELQQQISQRKPEILAFLQRAQAGAEPEPIRPRLENGPAPLAMPQIEIWPQAWARRDTPAFQFGGARRIQARLDQPAFERAYAEIVRRHTSLRTIFPRQAGQPLQVVVPAGGSPVEFFDLRPIPAQDRPAAFEAEWQRQAARPLDLEHGPLFRVALFQLADDDFIRLHILHELVADCIAEDLIEDEAARLYAAFAAGQPSPLAEPALQYADFACWQQAQLGRGAFQSQLEGWKTRLGGERPRLERLAGQDLRAARSTRAVRRETGLPLELTRALQGLARRENCTLYMILLAAFDLFLARHSGQEQLLVGTPVAYRMRPGLEAVVGRFLNPLVLRSDLSGGLTFRQLLDHTRQTVLEAFSNQDAPYPEVLKAVQPAGTPGEPLFQVQLNFAPMSDQGAGRDQPPLGEPWPVDAPHTHCPLTLYVYFWEEALQLAFIAQDGLFHPEQLEAFLQQMAGLLAEIVQDPDRRLEAYEAGLPAGARAARPRGADEQHQAARPEPAAETGPLAAPAATAPAAVEPALAEIWKKILKVKTVAPQDSFFDLGGHSFQAMRMVMAAQEAFGVNLPLNQVFRQPTLQAVAAVIQAQAGGKPWPSLVELQPAGDRPPFYCVHGITGDTVWFEDLTPLLPPGQPFYGLQSQGMDGLQPPLETIEAMASRYTGEIRRLQPHGPYFLAGYSDGSIIAYEMACQLRAAGQEVGLLLLIDQANPASDYYQARLGWPLLLGIARSLPYRVRDILALRPEQFMSRVSARLGSLAHRLGQKLRAVSPLPADGQVEEVPLAEVVDYAGSLPAHIQNVIAANYAALQKYRPKPYPGRLTLIRARGGRLLCSHDPSMGWSSLAGEVEVHLVNGSHLSLFRPPHIQSLAAVIRTCLPAGPAPASPAAPDERIPGPVGLDQAWSSARKL